MLRKIRKAAVIGSGVMGSGIAAHLANVGIPTYLLDIVPPSPTEDDKKKDLTAEQSQAFRNKLAQEAKERLLKTSPSPLYSKSDVNLITVGNIEDDLSVISDVDWVIEVIVENLEVKKAFFERLEGYWKDGIIVSTNTSGVSINAMVEGRSDSFRKHFLGTHFFNPPRYMKLLEIIPGNDTEQDIVGFMSDFCDKTLGKGVVVAKDTPNFIANRIGTYGLLASVEEMMKLELSIEEVDLLTGPVMGRPKSATFRTLDLVGLDTFVNVARNVYQLVDEPKEKAVFDVPPFIQEMVKQGRLGNKTGKGFYQKVKSAKGKEIHVLDYRLNDYRPAAKCSFASLEAAKQAKSAKEKIRTLMYADDKAGLFTWNVTKKVLVYAANKIPKIADDIYSVDQAMKWGFNWDFGPFELWDAIGVEKSVARMKEEGEEIPALVQNLLSSGKKSFYEENQGNTFYFSLKGDHQQIEEPKERIILKKLKEQNKVIKKNSGASLIDIGDGVACLEFHSPNNAIGADIVQMIHWSLGEVAKNYRGLVIGNQAQNFCVGANLMMLLMEAQDDNWFEIEQMVKAFQDVTMSLKYFEKPIVSAPFGMTLGGGAEVCFPTSKIQTAGETYMGLVEVGVGLIPGGGGNKEVLLRNIEGADVDGKVDLQPYVNRAFETIAMAKVSTSAKEAKDLGLLQNHDQITVNKDYLIHDAKQSVLALEQAGFMPKVPKKVRVVGESGLAVLKLGIYQMKCSGFISDHDEKIAKKLAYVLAGGDIPANTYVSEQYLLDLEREAFLSLCGEQKSQERMQHMLTKGKPLRN
jgi:3-hydroxyacyl-CoA dehydrogenase